MDKEKLPKRNYSTIFLFVIILLVGFMIRFWDLKNNPPGFFADEASIGYNAYSILKTGRDEFGNKFPLFFKAFGEYKNPIDIYSTVPFIFLFGLNEVSVRSVSVFFSILSMMALFFIGKRIKNNYLGLILMFVYAITPWSIHISRMNLEGMNHLIFFVLLGLFFLNEFYNTNKTLFLFSSYIFFGLATYSYFPGRITIPLFIFINTILLFLKNKSKYKVFLPSLVYFLIIIPLIFHILLGNGLARWQQVSIFNVHNINPWQKIIKSYLLHFSPDFLFLKGDIGMIGQFITRHSIKDFGEFYLWQAPFILLSIFYLIKKRRRIFYSIITILLIYPLSSALTTDVFPQATRSIIGIIPFTLFTGAGLIYFFDLLKNKKFIKYFFIFLISIIIFMNFFSYLKSNDQYRFYSADFWGWQYGPREIITYFKTQSKNYDELYITGYFNAPEIFLKFYDPENKCKNCFIGETDKYNSTKRQLFALRIEEAMKINYNYKIKKTIFYPNGDRAFYIIEPSFLK